MWHAISTTLFAATLAALTVPAGAQSDFIPRPTEAYECSSLAALRGSGSIWHGRFHGTKEVERSLFGRDTTGETRAFIDACFEDERNCRNWLYNYLSEYRLMVWTAECSRGLP